MKPRNDGSGQDDLDILPLLAAGVALAAVSWVAPVSASLLGGQHLPGDGIFGLIRGSAAIAAEGHWSDPRAAYSADAAAVMPSGVAWWFTALLGEALIGLAVGLVVRRVEPEIARPRIGRRPGDPRGSRPRAWGRPRDFILPRDDRGFTLGRLDNRTITTSEQEHVALVAPTRAGKTTRFVIPWLLEHDGPAIVTSTKRDVLDATREHRDQLGTVWVYDPFAPDSAHWTPLHGCDDWSFSLRTAHWLADATQQGDSEIASYWRGEAAKLLAPLLHAAALSGASMAEVLEWVDSRNTKKAALKLAAAGAMPAAQQLDAVQKLDDRNRGTTFMSAGSVLAVYRYPEVLATDEAVMTPDALITELPRTLYIVAPERHQKLLTPLMVSLLSGMLHHALETDRLVGKSPRLRVLLDEAANIAPLQELPGLLSQAAGHGIRIATVWQSLSQIRERYGASGDTILANATSKVFLGPISDPATMAYLSSLVADAEGDASTARSSQWRKLERGRALALAGSSPPVLLTPRQTQQARSARR